MKKQPCNWMKEIAKTKFLSVIAVLLVLSLAAPAMSQPDSRRAADCTIYARNQADMNTRGGGRILGGAMSGALGGRIEAGFSLILRKNNNELTSKK